MSSDKDTSFIEIFISVLIPVHSTEDDDRLLISDFYKHRCYCYCSCTRAVSCCWDKMCFVCLSYLLDRTRVDDDDRHGVGIQLALRNDRMVHDECGCRSRRGMCGGTQDKALRSCESKVIENSLLQAYSTYAWCS